MWQVICFVIVNKNQGIEGWKQLLRSHSKLVAEPKKKSWALKIPDFPALTPTPLHRKEVLSCWFLSWYAGFNPLLL